MRILLLWLLLPLGLFSQSGNLDDFALPPRQSPTPRTNQTSAQLQEEKAKNQRLEAVNQQLAAELQAANQRSDSLLKAQAGGQQEWDLWNEQNKEKYTRKVESTYWMLLLWLVGSFALILFGLYYFNFTAGLGRKKYHELMRLIDEDDTIPFDEKANRYPQNPHREETLGLPKGTVRGFLTITLLIANCLILYIIHYAPPSALYEGRLEYIKTAFLMMIAFYFGSKAVDALQVREETRRTLGADAGAGAGSQAAQPSPARPVSRALPELLPVTSPLRVSEPPDSKVLKSAGDTPDNTRPSREKCLSLTAYFETGKKFAEACGIVSGNFDGMGISFGCLQWNLGQGSLQPILQAYFDHSGDDWRNDLNLKQLHQVLQMPRPSQLDWAKSIQEQKGKTYTLFPEWQETFRYLGEKTRQFQLNAAGKLFDVAEGWCQDYGLTSERALALMFDIRVQNGLLYKGRVREKVRQRIENAGNPDEASKLVIIAEERANLSIATWRPVVLARKLTIARGRGKVYGAMVDLDDFGITMNDYA